MYCNELKGFAQEQEQELISALTDTREYPSPDGETRSRDNYQRGYACILHSSSSHRLQGKAQLLEIDPERFNKNRLTHSFEVAQIVRSIVPDLKLVNPMMVGLAALVYDIRNPPFGCSGEKLFNELFEEIGGYEGNIQALRILRRLEKKSSYCNGLNLTHRSLLPAVKYPTPHVAATAGKFIYDDGYYFYINLPAEDQLDLNPGEKTIDTRIMDLADETAYAAHGLEDALSRNMVMIEDIECGLQISDEFRGTRKQFKEAVTQSRSTAFQVNLLKTSEEFTIIFRKELTSSIVNRLTTDISAVASLSGFQELGFGKLNALSGGLKELLFKAIIRRHNILTYEFRGNKTIKDSYDFYGGGENYKFLPSKLKFTLPQPDPCIFKINRKRAVVDCISGMMDIFVVKEWEAYYLKWHCRPPEAHISPLWLLCLRSVSVAGYF